MKVGELVRSRNSESGMLGIVVGWGGLGNTCPVVHWNDGRINWVMPHLIKVIV
jgi:hypothetical protein